MLNYSIQEQGTFFHLLKLTFVIFRCIFLIQTLDNSNQILPWHSFFNIIKGILSSITFYNCFYFCYEGYFVMLVL